MHPIDKKGMFLHKLGVDTIFHSLKNSNTISSKFFSNILLNQASTFH